MLILQQSLGDKSLIYLIDRLRVKEYLEDIYYTLYRAAYPPLKLLLIYVLNGFNIFRKVPDLVQNAKLNIKTINKIVKKMNIERGQHPEKGVINLVTLNHY
jgi:hypothetical protein